jgi:hypothetical protein
MYLWVKRTQKKDYYLISTHTHTDRYDKRKKMRTYTNTTHPDVCKTKKKRRRKFLH